MGNWFDSYEFIKLTGALNQKAQRELRRFSTRAEITSTRFYNIYHWGRFKGDPTDWLARYFDLYLYSDANGTNTVGMSFDVDAIDTASIEPLLSHSRCQSMVWQRRLILFFDSPSTPTQPLGLTLDDLASLHTEILAGDLRPLFLAKLASIKLGASDKQSGGLLHVPQGLGQLTFAQENFAALMRLDEDLLSTVSEHSPNVTHELITTVQTRAWLQEAPPKLLEDLLVSIVHDEDPHLLSKLKRQIRRELQDDVPKKRLSISELKQQVLTRREEAYEREMHRRREQRLKDIAKNEEEYWDAVDAFIAKMSSPNYIKAANVLLDLQESLRRQGELLTFNLGLHEIYRQHHRKTKLIQVLEEHGLEDPNPEDDFI